MKLIFHPWLPLVSQLQSSLLTLLCDSETKKTILILYNINKIAGKYNYNIYMDKWTSHFVQRIVLLR